MLLLRGVIYSKQDPRSPVHISIFLLTTFGSIYYGPPYYIVFFFEQEAVSASRTTVENRNRSPMQGHSEIFLELLVGLFLMWGADCRVPIVVLEYDRFGFVHALPTGFASAAHSSALSCYAERYRFIDQAACFEDEENIETTANNVLDTNFILSPLFLLCTGTRYTAIRNMFLGLRNGSRCLRVVVYFLFRCLPLLCSVRLLVKPHTPYFTLLCCSCHVLGKFWHSNYVRT